MADIGQSIISDVIAEVDSADWLRDDMRSNIMLLKKKFEECADVEAELRKLYAVQSLDGFAMRLLWILELAKQGNGGTALNEAQREAVAEARRCFGIEPSAEGSAAPSRELESAILAEAEGGDFGTTFEKFVVAMQSGDETRETYLNGLLEQCESMKVSSDAGTMASLAEEVGSFLTFIKTNDLMDDVRVMNILSNLGDSVARALNAPADQREGFISEAVEVIKDFKTLFE